MMYVCNNTFNIYSAFKVVLFIHSSILNQTTWQGRIHGEGTIAPLDGCWLKKSRRQADQK